MKSRHIRDLSIFGSTLLAFCITVAASRQGTSTDKQNRKNFPPRRQEAIHTWRKFMDEDVPYIITDEERAAAKKLTTDRQRDDFITAFWERRNPNPGSPENAFEEEHYRRIAYANSHFFTDNVPGWKTNRGHVYVVYGPPDSVLRHRFGTNPPDELWTYRHLPGADGDVTLKFVDRCACGEFVLVSDLPNHR